MSLVKRECQHDGSCCCNLVRILKGGPVTNHILTKLKANGLGLSCPESEYGPQAIVKHIRECCGCGDFIDELDSAPVNTATLNEDLPNYSVLGDERFLLFLALILDKDFGKSVSYDRLFNCIPGIKKYLVESKPLASEYMSPFGEFVTLDRFLDFDFCIREVRYFSYSISISDIYYTLSVSDIEAAGAAGAEIPKAITKLCKNIRKDEVVLEITGKHEPFIIMTMSWEFSTTPGGYCESYAASVGYYEITSGGKLKHENVPTAHGKITLAFKHIHNIPVGDVECIFRQASHFSFPVYVLDKKVYITRSSCKSARGQ